MVISLEALSAPTDAQPSLLAALTLVCVGDCLRGWFAPTDAAADASAETGTAAGWGQAVGCAVNVVGGVVAVVGGSISRSSSVIVVILVIAMRMGFRRSSRLDGSEGPKFVV